MKFFRILKLLVLVPLCSYMGTALADYSSAGHHSSHFRSVGAVFTQTNDANDNQILMYGRNSKGKLKYTGAFSTGGQGTSAGLGNQGAVVLSHHNRWLFSVNAGSNEISTFVVLKHGLKLVDKVASGGERPVSLSVFHNILYVLNAGSDSISGFTISHGGKLKPIPDSTRLLSGVGTAAAQIQFSPWGDTLAVTEKATNLIDIFMVNEDGTTGDAIISESVGVTPFGFDFDRRGHLVVSEAAGGSADAGSLSSYSILNDGALGVISGAVATTETAACWLVISPNGHFAYTTNAGSSSISGYRIYRDGSLELLDEDGVTGDTGEGSAPLDMAMSRNGRFLYAISPSSQEIVSFKAKRRGGLRNLESVEISEARFNGIAAY